MEEVAARNPPSNWRNLWNICHKNDFPIYGVTIRKAPEPEEIRWLNIGFPVKTKYCRKAATWVITIALIAVSLAISIGIIYIDQDSISREISIGISLVVTAFNVGIQMVIMLLHTTEN